MNRKTYTKIFLKQAGRAVTEENISMSSRVWWKNNRTKKEGGLRLTDKGFEFLTDILELASYEVPFTDQIELSPQIIIFLDKFLDCPYFLDYASLTVFSEKKSFELYMFSDDIRKYGLIKAINKQKKSEET